MNLALRLTGIWLVYAAFQIMLFDGMTINQVARPFVFLLFLLMVPASLSKPVKYLMAFSAGLFIDIFTQTMGLHAFSCVLMMALRPYWIDILTGSSSLNRSKEELTFSGQSLSWIASYLFPLIFIHHLSFFMLEASGFAFDHFFQNLFKVLSSSLYTFTICFIVFGIFYKQSSSR